MIRKLGTVLRRESALFFGVATTILFVFFGNDWLLPAPAPWLHVLLFAWLFGVMLWLSFRVVHHADALAVLLGEPYGTLILTLSVIGIEVIMMVAVMLTGKGNPTLARDTMFAVLMIVLNGMVGLALLLGGLRYHEQEYNLRGASAYLTLICSLATLGLILPRLTTSAPGGEASPLMAGFLIVMSCSLYAVFLGLQTMRYRHYFTQAPPDPGETAGAAHGGLAPHSIAYHALFLILTLLPIVLLSKHLARLIDLAVVQLALPQAVGGFLVAALVLSPEGLSALRAASANRLQRAINICLGSALATIGLTIPSVLLVGFVTGVRVELGLEFVDIALLVLTLAVSTINFGAGGTNVLQGAVHLLLFLTYIVLMFE